LGEREGLCVAAGLARTAEGIVNDSSDDRVLRGIPTHLDHPFDVPASVYFRSGEDGRKVQVDAGTNGRITGNVEFDSGIGDAIVDYHLRSGVIDSKPPEI